MKVQPAESLSSQTLWPREVKVLGAQNGITSVTFYTIDPAATSFDAFQADVRERLLPIIAANPWLGARLLAKGPSMEYADKRAAPTDPPTSFSAESVCERVFGATTDAAIHPTQEYNALSVAVAAHGVHGAKQLFKSGNPVSRMVCIDVSPDCVALIWSVSHAVADGYTYYRLLNMLADNVLVEPMPPQVHLMTSSFVLFLKSLLDPPFSHALQRFVHCLFSNVPARRAQNVYGGHSIVAWCGGGEVGRGLAGAD